MLSVEEYEAIRRAYYVEKQSQRAIARQLQCSPKTIRKALAQAEPVPYQRREPWPAPKLGPFHARLAEILAANEKLPPKQRYTSHKVFLELQAAGYTGGESTVRGYLSRQRATQRRPAVFLPLEFEPGQDAQVDWGEAEVVLAGVQTTVQLFVLRLNYSRQVFVAAYPTQEQEAFFDGHVRAFRFLGGVPRRLTYDNLSSAVRRVAGRAREEQRSFVAFRSHYLFDARFCTPGEGHEKGGVEHGVGYVRRNFCVPLPEAADFAALNAQLAAACERDAQRTVAGQTQPIHVGWAEERPHFLPLPAHDYACCATAMVALNPYSQVTYATNRYSVPVARGRATLVVKAYPFTLEITDGTDLLATHPRCYGREQDILELAHYLPLLEQRPGALEHAKPLRQARAQWAPVYEQLFQTLQAQAAPPIPFFPEFAAILRLRDQHPAALVEQAIATALAHGCPHLAGVQLCLYQLEHPTEAAAPLDMHAYPGLARLGQQPIDLHQYDRLLGTP